MLELLEQTLRISLPKKKKKEYHCQETKGDEHVGCFGRPTGGLGDHSPASTNLAMLKQPPETAAQRFPSNHGVAQAHFEAERGV